MREYIFPWQNEWKTRGRPGKGATSDHPCSYGRRRWKYGCDIDAAIAQLFVTHNRMHDWSYFLGFTSKTESAVWTTWQHSASRENDPEIGNVQAGAVSRWFKRLYLGRDNANQITLQDGVPGITNQYLSNQLQQLCTALCDGDMDVGIVGHEYTHAISNRMVGVLMPALAAHKAVPWEKAGAISTQQNICSRTGLFPQRRGSNCCGNLCDAKQESRDP